MAKITLSNLANLQNQNTAVTTINANNDALETAVENTLSRDGTSPNSMGANLDMDSHRIINLPEPISPVEPLRLQDLTDFTGTGSILLNAIPVGGTDGQTLTKQSSANYDAAWETIVSPAVLPATTAATVPLATNALKAHKYGIIPCTASYVNNAGVGEYTLTITSDAPSLPASLEDGMRFRFNAPETADVGIMNVKVNGVSNGFLNTKDHEGSWLTFHDIAKNEDIILEYSSTNNYFVKISGTTLSTSYFPQGDAYLGGGGFFGVGPGNQQCVLNAGTIILKNPNTGAFQTCRIQSVTQSLFNNTAYVKGVANQNLAGGTFYYVFAFMNSPTNSFSAALDFYPVVPASEVHTYTTSNIGTKVLSTDQTRTYMGNLYTGAGDVGFKGSGTNMQSPMIGAHIPSLTILPMTSGIITGTTSSSTFADITTAAVTFAVKAETHIPMFWCSCNYNNTVNDGYGEMRLKYEGLAIDGSGASTTYTAFTDVSKANAPSAGGYTHLQNNLGLALSSGWIKVTPQIRVTSGTGTFETNTTIWFAQ